MNKGEAWRPIPGYSVYEVSDLGRVRSLDRLVVNTLGRERQLKGRVLSPAIATGGYSLVTLYRGGGGDTGTSRTIHTLVLRAFVGECPAGLEACHDNGDPADNRLKNLRWDTHANNCADKLSHGTHIRGERNPRSRITESQAYRIKFGSERGVDLAREFGVTPRLIYDTRAGRNWAWLQSEADEMAAIVAWVNNLPEGAAA